MAKEKRHKATLIRGSATATLDAILEESRALRRQMADDLNDESKTFRKMSRHLVRSRQLRDSDEQSA